MTKLWTNFWGQVEDCSWLMSNTFVHESLKGIIELFFNVTFFNYNLKTDWKPLKYIHCVFIYFFMIEMIFLKFWGPDISPITQPNPTFNMDLVWVSNRYFRTWKCPSYLEVCWYNASVGFSWTTNYMLHVCG